MNYSLVYSKTLITSLALSFIHWSIMAHVIILSEDLGMGHVPAKFVLLLVTEEQKENHLSVASHVLKCAETNEAFYLRRSL